MSITLEVQASESSDFTNIVITHTECGGGQVRILPNPPTYASILKCEKCNLILNFKDRFSEGENILVRAANSGKEGTIPGDHFWDCPVDIIVVATVGSRQ